MVRAVSGKQAPMSEKTSVPASHARAVRRWLLAVAAMIFLTLVVGGATRLTESGLSITEWKPVAGVLPPVSEQAWQDKFKAYQAIPQYQERNRGMSLDEFKVIYWWEWTHRVLARSTGFVFLLPFLFFLWRGWVPKRLRARLWTIFAGGALLGAVGWWMVASGLAGSGRVSVSQYRLAFHLTLACAIYAAVLWTAQQLVSQRPGETAARLRIGALAIAGLLLVQIYLGALVAGTDAGLAYNTWPLIDGSFIPAPDHLWFLTPAWRNFFENTLTVQFDHRMLAYAIWLGAMVHANDAWRVGREARGALILAGAVTVQAVLGVVTLVNQSAIPLALAHQILAILVFTIAILHAERLWHRDGAAAVGALTAGARA
jgi:cytochrome c oxidase assembly protein subunit 15